MNYDDRCTHIITPVYKGASAYRCYRKAGMAGLCVMHVKRFVKAFKSQNAKRV